MTNTYGVSDIVNQAARAAGVPLRVQEMYEGSDLSKAALEIWSQARDELLASRDWSFSSRQGIYLTKLKGPPPPGGFTPAIPWSNIYAAGFLYEYAYPLDCLDLRAVYEPPGLMPDGDPLPVVWRIIDDPTPIVSGLPPVASGPEARVILTNVTNAMATYRAQITDISVWSPLFVTAMVASLGRKLATVFGAQAAEKRENAAESLATIQGAGSVRG